MPATKNLIALKQLRQDQLSGFALAVASGFVVTYVSGASGSLYDYINDVSGALSDAIDNISGGTGAGNGVADFRVPIALGVDTIHCLYGQSYSSNVSIGQIGTSGAADPFIYCMPTNINATGTVLELSAVTTSTNYYLNLILPST